MTDLNLNSKYDVTLKNYIHCVENKNYSISDIQYIIFTIQSQIPVTKSLYEIAKVIHDNLHHEHIYAIKYIDKKKPLNSFVKHLDDHDDKQWKKKGSFNNQLTLLLYSPFNKKTNIKLFKNGVLQITGCSCLKTGKDVFIHFCQTLHKMSLLNSSNFMFNGKIFMINTKFECNFNIDRLSLNDVLNNMHHTNIITELDGYKYFIKNTLLNMNRYQAINMKLCISGPCLKMNKITSILIFRTGKVLITGAKSELEVKLAYNFMKYLFDNNKQCLRCTSKK